MTGEINVGIIGIGRHGARYAEHISNDVEGLSLAAVSRRTGSGREQAAAWGTRLFPDWRALVRAPGVEAVIAVATPDLNEAIGLACVEAGKPLLVEKPLAVDRGAAERLVEGFYRAGLPLTVGQTLRYNGVIQGLRRELPRCGTLFSFCASQRLEPTLHTWMDDPRVAGGGVILHTAVHLFDALRFITGREVERVRASMFSRRNSKVENLFTAQLEMTDGLVGVVDASKLGSARCGRYEFVGEQGTLQGDQVHDILQRVEGMTVRDVDREPLRPGIVPLLRDWRDHLRGRGPNPVDGAQGLAAVRIADACRRAAKNDGWEKV
jgi:predicted dehydrogenase